MTKILIEWNDEWQAYVTPIVVILRSGYHTMWCDVPALWFWSENVQPELQFRRDTKTNRDRLWGIEA